MIKDYGMHGPGAEKDRKSTRLNSSHVRISYAVCCLKKDGHTAAPAVRDEFVSVTERLMVGLAQCYNVLPQLDLNNPIGHRPEGYEKWFVENANTCTQFCRKVAAGLPLKDIRDEYNYPKKKGIKDECSRLLESSTMISCIGFPIQRLITLFPYTTLFR